MPDDCLICLRPLRRPWSPTLTCNCRPLLHKTCWDGWVAHVGYPSCVICRGAPQRPPDRALVLIPVQAPLPWWRDMEALTTAIGIVFLIWMMFILSQPISNVTIYVPPYQQRPLWPHDEL